MVNDTRYSHVLQSSVIADHEKKAGRSDYTDGYLVLLDFTGSTESSDIGGQFNCVNICRKLGKYLINRDFKFIKNLHSIQAKRHVRRSCGSNMFREDKIGHFFLMGLGEGFRKEAS